MKPMCSFKRNITQRMIFDNEFINELLSKAKENVRQRQNFDLRTSTADQSQRMLNALLPGTEVAIHQHADTTETVVCLIGRLDEVIYEKVGEDFREVERIHLSPAEGKYGCQIPQGVWHTVKVIEPSVIFEAKDGAYVAG